MRLGQWLNRSRGSLDQPRRGSGSIYGAHERRGSLVDELTRQSLVFFDDDDFDREDEEDVTSGTGSDGSEVEEMMDEEDGVEEEKEDGHVDGMDGNVESEVNGREKPTVVG
jgi:hypothetical protein